MSNPTPVQTLKELGLLSWSVLIIGEQRGWIEKSDIADYATNLLVANLDNGNEDIAVLAGANQLGDFEVQSSLSNLTKHSGSASGEVDLEKWRLAMLVSLDSSALSDGEKISRLQDIYGDFGYPEDMSACSIYSSSSIDPLVAMRSVIAGLKSKLMQ